MSVLNWITDNWVNILAFMGALNMLAQTITRFKKGEDTGSLADKTVTGLKVAASLGMHKSDKKPTGGDSVPV